MCVLGNTTIIPADGLFVMWAGAFFVTGSRWSNFPCPRCDKLFFKPNAGIVNQLGNRCPHCGLPRYAEE